MTDKLSDFAETAAIVDQIDLGIAIDTAAVYLAGALGKPVWTILQFGDEWRWLFRREDALVPEYAVVPAAHYGRLAAGVLAD